MKIYILGLGTGDINYMSKKAYDMVTKSNLPIYLRTKEHPTVEFLDEKHIKYESLDRFYSNKDFEQVYESISEYIIMKVKEKGKIIYLVPGNPATAENTTDIIKKKASLDDIDIEIIPSTGYIEIIATRLKEEYSIDISKGTIISDSTILNEKDINTDYNILISQVYDRFVASDIKLKLLSRYQDDVQVLILKSIGNQDEKIIKTELYKLDNIKYDYNHLTSIFVMKTDKKRYRDVYDILYKLIDLKKDNITIENIQKQILDIVREIDYENIDELIDKYSKILNKILLTTIIEKEKYEIDFLEITEKAYENLYKD